MDVQPDQYLPRHRGVKPGQRTPRFVYFIRAENLRLVKIGAAVEPSERLATLRCGCPDQLTLVGVIQTEENAYELERRLHHRFRDHWSHGEWFRLDEALEAFMAAEVIDYGELLSRENRDLANRILSRRLEKDHTHE